MEHTLAPALKSDGANDPGRRQWLLATAGAGGMAAVATAVPFVSTFAPSERAKAMGAAVEVDIGDIPPGGYFCPCHGSTFDGAGRAYKNKPAPTNLEVPPHRYVSETRILVGDDTAA